MLLAYLYLALLEPKTPPKQLRRPCRELLPKRSRKEVERRAQIQIYSNRAPDYCIFVSGRKILSRNKFTVIGIPITVHLFLDSTAAISQNQNRKEVERSAQKQILTPTQKQRPLVLFFCCRCHHGCTPCQIKLRFTGGGLCRLIVQFCQSRCAGAGTAFSCTNSCRLRQSIS